MPRDDGHLREIITLIIAVIGWIVHIIRQRAQKAPPPARRPVPVPVRAPAPVPARRLPRPSAIDEIEAEALALAEKVKYERANRRFHETLATWVPARAAAIRSALARPDVAPERLGPAIMALTLVVAEIDGLAEQRRDPTLLPELGDADALADACYAPIVDFSRRTGLALTSSQPAAQITDFDLAVWTGFIPTSIAPIFLPPDFFSRLAWWPAIGHEIGHDFLASLGGLEPALRRELRLPPEEIGAQPLSSGDDLRRIFGAWLEEIFADVFGTLMCGPAFIHSMDELFSDEDDPRRLARVGQGGRGGYDRHPPRHLRVLMACRVLDRAGFAIEAGKLRAAWEERHLIDGLPIERLVYPTLRGLVAVPLEPVVEIAFDIVDRLVEGPLVALGGGGLESVPMLDYGPAEHAAAERVKADLLAGRLVSVRDPRAVIAGAVLALRVAPEKEAVLLERARAAIPAVGTGEARPDAYSAPAVRSLAPAAALLADAMVLRAILSGPRARPGGRL